MTYIKMRKTCETLLHALSQVRNQLFHSQDASIGAGPGAFNANQELVNNYNISSSLNAKNA